MNPALSQVPGPYRKIVREACEQVLGQYDDIRALVLIGSVAEGDFGPKSDVDLLCIKGERVGWEEQRSVTEGLDDRVQLIVFSEEMFRSHIEKRTTMAHSVLRGMILYEVGDYVSGLNRNLDLPDREWMKNWFVHWLRLYEYSMGDVARAEEWHGKYCDEEKCVCHIDDTIARVAVNLAILFLETRGIVPTTKVQVQRHFEEQVEDEVLRVGLCQALSVSREKRWIDYSEAQPVVHVAAWLRDQLMGTLRPSPEDLRDVEATRRVIQEVRKEIEERRKRGLNNLHRPKPYRWKKKYL